MKMSLKTSVATPSLFNLEILLIKTEQWLLRRRTCEQQFRPHFLATLNKLGGRSSDLNTFYAAGLPSPIHHTPAVEQCENRVPPVRWDYVNFCNKPLMRLLRRRGVESALQCRTIAFWDCFKWRMGNGAAVINAVIAIGRRGGVLNLINPR